MAQEDIKFVVSARKYRPGLFEEVLGQEAITATLKNAILNKQVAQAFLFCGPRGVGKTTCARILAKTLNCLQLTSEGEACGECDNCKAFEEGNSMNVFELDAASNNTVDDIRNLINQVRIAPSLGSKKVYIIDEVHMLSQSAFNAFLKTLEEPPKHAVFILATTEKHKILPTILSRCQIFNFNRIGVDYMVTQLKTIANAESIVVEEEALHLIALKADGGMRDALSIFDQMVSFGQGQLKYQEVINNLNILDYDYYFKVSESILQKNISGTLLLLGDVLDKGFDEHQFMMGLAEHFRNVLLSKDVTTLKLIELGEKIKAKYQEQSQQFTQDQLLSFLSFCNDYDVQYKTNKNKRLLTEITLLKFCAENTDELKKKSLSA